MYLYAILKQKAYYIIVKNGKAEKTIFTSLTNACKYSGLNYWTVVRNFEEEFICGNTTITKAVVSKQSGKRNNRVGLKKEKDY